MAYEDRMVTWSMT